MFFYLWIFVVPPLLPRIAHAPESRPLVLISRLAASAARSVYSSMNIFTETWWKAWPVRWTSMALDLAVMARILSGNSADRLRYVVAHGQAYLVPMCTLVFPRAISSYGLLFVQYCQPLNKKQDPGMLRYWVLHCIFTSLVGFFAGVLWWIPLSTAITFALFLVLGLHDGMVERWFTILTNDLEAFRLLPSVAAEQQRSIDESWIVRALGYLLQKLPRAKGEEDMEEIIVYEADATDTAEMHSEESVASKTVESTADRDDLDYVSVCEPDDALECDPDGDDFGEQDDAACKENACNIVEDRTSATALRRSTRAH
jgi:hypothetical protein